MNINIKSKVKLVEYTFWTILISLLTLKYYLVKPINTDFLGTYKYFAPDSYDWIVNGMFIFKDDSISFRNPGLSVIIKVLDNLNALELLPLINQVLLLLLYLGVFHIVKNLTKRKLPAYSSLAPLVLNYGIHDFALYVLADLYAIVFITWALYFAITKKYHVSFFLLGFSALFQNFSFFLFPVFFIFYFHKSFKGRYVFSSKLVIEFIKRGIVASISLLHINLLWFGYKYVEFSDPMYTQIRHISLLKPHLTSIWFYLVNGYILLGFTILIMSAGLIKIKKHKLNEHTMLLMISLAVTLVFWITIYNWNDKRFLLYAVPFVFPLLGVVFSQVKTKGVLVLLVLLSTYPTIISTTGFFNYNYVPILHDRGLSFPLSVNSKGQANLATVPNTIVTDKTLFNFTFIGELIDKKAYNTKSDQTLYNEYSRLIDLTDICNAESIDVDSYIFNSIFFIQKEESLPKFLTTKCI